VPTISPHESASISYNLHGTQDYYDTDEDLLEFLVSTKGSDPGIAEFREVHSSDEDIVRFGVESTEFDDSFEFDTVSDTVSYGYGLGSVGSGLKFASRSNKGVGIGSAIGFNKGHKKGSIEVVIGKPHFLGSQYEPAAIDNDNPVDTDTTIDTDAITDTDTSLGTDTTIDIDTTIDTETISEIPSVPAGDNLVAEADIRSAGVLSIDTTQIVESEAQPASASTAGNSEPVIDQASIPLELQESTGEKSIATDIGSDALSDTTHIVASGVQPAGASALARVGVAHDTDFVSLGSLESQESLSVSFESPTESLESPIDSLESPIDSLESPTVSLETSLESLELRNSLEK